ncbi:MAG TPA: thermonuclease family protein [Peptostreptococcaceae bacterium]|nr:thermonuclease family protein [Peptostreptococcaceae bacterium]
MTSKLNSLLVLLIVMVGLNLTACSSDDIYTYDEQNTVVSNITDDGNASVNEGTEEVTIENAIYNVPEDSRKGTVIDSIDGDTIKVKFDNGDVESIRMLLINTPEKNEKFGSEASDFAYQELNNKIVYIEPDVESRDKYDRLLGYVWYEKNGQIKLYNKEIILASLSKVAYVYESKKHLDILNEAEESIRYNKLNIWEKEGYATNKGDKYDMGVYESSSFSSSNSSNTKNAVYTARTGSKYHLDKDCRVLAKASKISEKSKQEAINSGLSLCGYED